MIRSAFTPQPLLSAGPFLRPESPTLPEPQLRRLPQTSSITRHKTLPYGVPIVDLPSMPASVVQIHEERQSTFVPPVAVESVFTETQRLSLLDIADPDDLKEDHLRVFVLKMQRFAPLGIAASLGFLLAYFL